MLIFRTYLQSALAWTWRRSLFGLG